MIKLRALAGALLLSLAGCGENESGAEAAGHGNGPGASVGSANVAQSPGQREAPVAGDDRRQHDPRLLLTGSGVMADARNEIRFGADRGEAIRTLSSILGGAFRSNAVEDCGGSGPATAADWGPLVLFFQDDKFIGWEQRDASQRLRIGTAGGATIGARRPELEAAIGPVRIEQTSLGTEFSGNGVSGLLASDQPDAQVERLSAGSNCAMR